ncbi:toll/interleukin-1 receptor domain-containing protein [Cyclobacterium roseum]|uniref:toll/interleukin-1 receptor domain-containing protein n=1 Tax=Cyclobacterium roseum TaxID=2666137 RepID=UPI001390CB7A|nr:toll/interleukin-1 receptor domain-containing protein [Cyclobacterium roseum]
MPFEKNKIYQIKTNNEKKIDFNDLKDIILNIAIAEIEEVRIMENEISGIGLQNNKPIPHTFELEVLAEKPGHVKIKYKIPGTGKYFSIGELPIINKQVILPLNLAFLSYAKEDKTVVENVMSLLNENGVLTWYDDKDLLPGDDWESKIKAAMKASDFVLVFLSSKSLIRDGYKNKEMRMALENYEYKVFGKRYIIPILIDKCQPPSEFNKIHWLKMYDNGWETKLLSVISPIIY